MPDTLEGLARSFAEKYPRPSDHPFGGDSSWDQDCGSLMNRMCVAHGHAPTGDIRSAYIVYERSAIVSTDSSKANPGDFHFWDIAGRLNGHVGLDVVGGGTRVFMGTNSVSVSLGAGIGFLSVDGYTKAKSGRAKYLGFSRGYANGDVTEFAASSTSGAALNMTDLPKVKKEEDMIYPWVFITEDARIGGVWWKYDGRAKYMCAPGDPQLLVDLGLAAKVEVKVLGPRIGAIPTGTV